MKQSIFEINENVKIAADVYRMVLSGDTSAITAPGQFVNIKLYNKYLRRPISVCDLDGDRLTLIYKVVGGGTREMSEYRCGTKLDLLTGLGNGYDLTKSGDAPLLIGGGVGVPPLYLTAKQLIAEGKNVTVICGFRSCADAFLIDEFSELGARVYLTTEDGSRGTRGFVTSVMPELSYSYVYTCGPEPMLRAVYNTMSGDGQFSFEERMGCGFGACMGCSCKTVTGYKRICRDGPVLEKNEILWK